ncbi:uncharacterized [Tachysurus ichikawai]
MASQVGVRVLWLLLESSEVSEAATEAAAGRPISGCWPGSEGMRQIQRACQTAGPKKEAVIWWELQAGIEIFVEFEGWAEDLVGSLKVLEVGIEVLLGFGLMELSGVEVLLGFGMMV